MKLRLYHHHDGARVAYREAGTGPPLALLHSAGLTHREWEPVVEELTDRFRLVLPDLPLHGDSEDHPRHPYSPEWLTEVMTGFVRDVCGPRPLVGGHDLGAEVLLRAVTTRRLTPGRLVIMPCPLHRRPRRRTGPERIVRAGAVAAAVPGLDRVVTHGARLVFRPGTGEKLTARHNPAVRDLVRHALADLGGNVNRARAWSKAVRRWPDRELRLLDAYRHIEVPVLLLWADEDPLHPVAVAEEALDLLPDAQLRILPGTGYLMAYDDPVGLAREIAAFCL